MLNSTGSVTTDDGSTEQDTLTSGGNNREEFDSIDEMLLMKGPCTLLSCLSCSSTAHLLVLMHVHILKIQEITTAS